MLFKKIFLPEENYNAYLFLSLFRLPTSVLLFFILGTITGEILEKEMATHPSIAWRIPWTEEVGGL